MKCPRCESTSYRKNGRRNGKQYYLCKNCRKQFFEPALVNSLKNQLIADSNGHTQLPLAEATELSLIENSLTEKATEEVDQSFALTLVNELLQTVLSPEWLESPEFSQFIQKIHQKIESKTKLDRGISLLLLDVENLKLDIPAENFLASICNYPLQVKIAFANWKNPSNSKQDIELYERGYQLVHVPEGKDSADAKMIAFGAGLSRYYPTVKEILVCSGDRILSHLCNELQNQGMLVYWVRRQSQILYIENRNTGKFIYYSLPLVTEIPSLEKVVEKIDNLIKSEQESISSRLSDLMAIANLFQERCNLQFNKKKSTQDDQATASSEKINSTEAINSVEIVSSPKDIGSKEDLEKLLLEIINRMQSQSPTTNLSVSILGTELQKVCGQSPNSIVKKLKLGSNFTKFLQSSTHFTLKPKGKQFEVTKSDK
ncbi:hypothetical protein NIES2100_75320 [Calothrix sp. NIES-2100]|uniref:IS1/IS1595 family N-terminal zinc-binding domain-containing protein n=1 Tax=Calothrix sp. NIES-2100 TaxID=1954172 RepID=UPI000B608CDD|nr:hypothetical protein NIES2100_75320 [Calothrix sp. NIES-2100]